jgi:hypothetical protein
MVLVVNASGEFRVADYVAAIAADEKIGLADDLASLSPEVRGGLERRLIYCWSAVLHRLNRELPAFLATTAA